MSWLGVITDLNHAAIDALIGLTFLYLITGADDFFVDLVALFNRLRPKRLSKTEVDRLALEREKLIAIMVPAWNESNIIQRMLLGNIANVDYKSYHFFVGVYPNDMKSFDEVTAVSKRFPNVHPVLNEKDGPTSKGQILNFVLKQILAYEKDADVKFDGFLMQDAEDIMHQKILQLVNHNLNFFDFVQTPVFSLPVPMMRLVAGSYMDEFAESHTKDLLVREHLGAGIPSAGVGTAFSRRVVEILFRERGYVYNEKSVTEDYELGLGITSFGFRSHFACAYYEKDDGAHEYIATREYFPRHVQRSIRQKTRWTVGIAIQGLRNLGWFGSLGNLYFLYRDRKGVLTNIATLVGYVDLIFLLATTSYVNDGAAERVASLPAMQLVGGTILFFTSNRLLQRTICTRRVYGWRGCVAIAPRWPLAIYINAFAAVKAIQSDLVSRFKKQAIAWVKTDHELPELFGKTVAAPEVRS